MSRYKVLTIVAVIAHFGCRNVSFSNEMYKNLIKEASISNTSIPAITYNQDDPSFFFKQDTLFYGDSKFDGHVIKLFANGDTAAFSGFLNGLQEGIAKKWYTPKILQETRYYSSGKKAGTHTGYWENGNTKFEYHFEEGEHEGVLMEWYQNGQAYRIFHYNKGYEEGSQKMWWENGIIRANYVVKNGRRFGLIGLKLCMNPAK